MESIVRNVFLKIFPYQEQNSLWPPWHFFYSQFLKRRIRSFLCNLPRFHVLKVNVLDILVSELFGYWDPLYPLVIWYPNKFYLHLSGYRERSVLSSQSDHCNKVDLWGLAYYDYFRGSIENWLEPKTEHSNFTKLIFETLFIHFQHHHPDPAPILAWLNRSIDNLRDALQRSSEFNRLLQRRQQVSFSPKFYN